jgi:hypothetical protein
MVNPTISKKSEQQLTVTDDMKKLFQIIYREENKLEEKEDDNVPRLRVSTMVSKMAFYYEKIRNSVDYKEEYLLRKNAIQRILHRQIVISGAMALNHKEFNNQEISRNLLIELIRAGYLSNNKIRESKIGEIGLIIAKYLELRKCFIDIATHNTTAASAAINKEWNDIINWLISLAASEIEANLCQNDVDQAVIGQMRKILDKNIIISAESPYRSDKTIQINVGIYRNFLKYDRDMLSFVLFKELIPEWTELADDSYIRQVAENITDFREKINFQLDHPLTGQFNRIISRYTVFFSILVEVIREDPRGVYEGFQRDPKAFPRLIKNIYNKKYATQKSKLWRAAVRSIIYIFLTKSILAIILEVPASQWFGEKVNDVSLAINVTFPALLLFVMVLFTKFPSADSSNKVVEGIEEIVFVENARQEPFELRPPAKRSRTMHAVFSIIYSITFFLTFGLVIWILNQIQFSWVSIIIFLFFLAFASFFSIRIRKNVKDLIVVQPNENILSFIADFFYVPIVATGKWLSEKFQRINVFVFFLDFIIEAPFKIFVEIAEEWTKYVKERKDELV